MLCYQYFLEKRGGNSDFVYNKIIFFFFFRSFFFKNAGVVLMTNDFVSDGREGEFAENKVWGILCHAILLTGYLIQKS